MKVLHVEDNRADAELVAEILTAEFPGCNITVVQSQEPFLAGLATDIPPDIILSDFTLPAFDGTTALKLACEHAPGIPFIFLSGSIGEERAIAAIRAGAYDYVLKDNMARLAVVISRALEDFAQRRKRKQDERRLLELAGIIERASDAIVASDMAGRITLWNKGAANLYGVPADRALGRVAEEVLSLGDLLHIRDAREATLETGEWQREVNLTTHDGRDIVIDIRMTLVRDDAGNPSARLSIAKDITEKKKLQEQSLRAQRLESLGMLAAGIAHDFNNVLTPVSMGAALLRQRLNDPGDIRTLDLIQKSVERGAGMVRQIVGFARGTGGELRLTRVQQMLRDIVEVVQMSFPESIVLNENVSNSLWPIQANPMQLHRVILNLVINARDAMLPRGGTLLLHAGNQRLAEGDLETIEGARAGEFVVITVGDTGSGMTPEVLARIWEPFFTTKGEGRGTGIGLSTVRGVVAAHGGFVTVDSRAGHGTRFRVFLPATELPENEPDRTRRP